VTTSDHECEFCDKEWVHVFERDSSAGAVFEPSGSNIPLSRRPRERLLLRKDGTAVIGMGQPDDRVGNRAARWSREGDDLVVREVDGTAAWRIVEHSRDRLLVRMD
jgi:hypothetical protein